MASERLQVILDMETGAYRREARKAADSTKEIGTSAETAGGKVGGLGAKFNNLGPAAAAGMIAAAGAIGVQALRIIGSLDAIGVEADAIRNRFDVVFGDTADDVRDWADDVNERFGVSVETMQDLANSLGDLLVPLGFTRREAANLTQEALTVANALSEWTGGQVSVAESAERIRKALLGQRRPLEELGVKILQSDLNARLAAKGQARLTGELRAQAEAQATLEIITAKSADAISAYEDNTNTALIAQKNFQSAVESAQGVLADFVSNEIDNARGGLILLSFILEDVTAQLNEDGSGEGLLEAVLNLIPGISGADDALKGLTQSYAETKAAQKGWIDGFERFKILLPTIDFASLSEAGQSFIETEEDAQQATQDLVDEITALAEQSGYSREGIERLADRGVDALAEAFGISAAEAENLIPILRRVAEALDPRKIDGYEERLSALGPAAEEAGENLEGVAENTAEISREAPLAAAGIRDLTSALSAQTSPVFRFLDALDKYGTTLADIDEDGKRTARESADLLEAFVDLAEASANLDDSDLERFAQVAIDVLDLSTQQAAEFIDQLEILTNRQWVVDVVSNLPGNTTQRVIADVAAAGYSFGDPERRAHGGSMNPGQPYIVGEQGVEVVIPNTSSYVVPNNQLGGTTNVINLGGITVTGGALSETDSARFARWLRRDIDRELADLRGGRV